MRFYWFVLAITAVLTFVLWWIVRSPWGRAFDALRENPLRAESLGVDVRLYTLLAFALGSAYGGMAGSLYAPLVEFIDPSPFALGPSLHLHADGGDRRQRHLPRARSSARGVAVLLPGMAARLGGLLPADLRRAGDGDDGAVSGRPRSGWRARLFAASGAAHDARCLEVRDIEKSFGGVEAVRGVSFDVNEGEILGVIGPNGSGKSTLFNCILGQLAPSARHGRGSRAATSRGCSPPASIAWASAGPSSSCRSSRSSPRATT